MEAEVAGERARERQRSKKDEEIGCQSSARLQETGEDGG